MVRKGCGADLYNAANIYYGYPTGDFYKSWLDALEGRHSEPFMLKHICGDERASLSHSDNGDLIRYCESCARRFGWIW
jgi:hypothetical protein